MNKEEITINRDGNLTKFRITQPLFSKEEVDVLDNYLHDVVRDINKSYVHDKDLAIMQEVTRRLEKENKELHNKIDKAIEYINSIDLVTYDYALDTEEVNNLLGILEG